MKGRGERGKGDRSRDGEEQRKAGEEGKGEREGKGMANEGNGKIGYRKQNGGVRGKGREEKK